MMETKHTQTVFVVDDDPAMRDAMATLLQTTGLPTRTFASAREFLDTFHPETRGCLLLDVRMPDMSGLELHRHLSSQGATIPVILVTAHGDVPMAVQAIKEGAFDFIEKPFHEERLLQRVHACLATDTELASQEESQSAARERLEQLSARELEVLDGIMAGQQSKVIAEKLGISPRTVDVHRTNILKKAQVRSVAELVRLVLSAQNRNT